MVRFDLVHRPTGELPTRTLLTLLASLVVLAAALRLGAEHAERAHAPTASGPFWSAQNAAGRLLKNRSLENGLWLAPGDAIRFDDREGDGLQFRRLDLDLAIAGRQSSTLHLDVRSLGAARVRLTVVPQRNVSAQLVTRAADGTEQVIASVEQEERRPRPRMPFRLSLRFDGPRVTAWLDGERLLEGEVGLPPRGAAALFTDGARLLGMRLEADRVDGEAEELVIRADDLQRDPPSRLGAWAGTTLLLLALFGLAGLYLRALCLGAPRVRDVIVATLALSAPAAALALVRPWWSSPQLPVVCGALALLGLPVALFVLRRELAASGGGSRAYVFRVGLVALPLVVASGALAWDARADRVEAAAARARAAAPTLSDDGASRADSARLDAGSAVVLGGPYGGFVLEADVRLGADAVLEVRQGRPDAAVGTALVLSADPRWPSRLLRLGPRHVDRLGRSGPVCAAGETRRLQFEARGARFTARWGNEVVADGEDLDACAGPVTLVAVRGEVDVGALELTPLPASSAGVRPSGVDEARPFLVGCAILLVGAWLVSRLLRRPLVRTLEVFAFALVPVAVALLPVDDGAVPTPWTLAAAAAAAGLLVGVPLAHGRGTSQLRLVPAVFVAIFAGAGAAVVILPGAGDGRDEAAVRALDFASFEGPRLLPGLIHYQHLRSRTLNGYLAGHTLRGRRFAVGRRVDGPRVVCVGSSSTWGAGTPGASGLDWPTVLEEHLPPGSEVMNGGIRGSNAALLSVFYEEVLGRFDPDVVVVTLFHNDAVTLPQLDAAALLERLTTAEGAVGPFARFLLRRELGVAVDANRRFLARYRPGEDPLAGWQAEMGIGARTPPERFLAATERLLDRVTASGARPILVKEPVFADQPMVWRSEFDAVLDRLGARYDAPVLDPTPALAARGGRDLFMDHVHLLPKGNRVMAELVAPAVVTELERGRRTP